LGYDPGPVDGVYGPVTIKAVKKFQSDYGLVIDGEVGSQTWGQLQALFCWQYRAPTDLSGATTDESTDGSLQSVAEVAVPGWDLVAQPVDAYSAATEAFFARKPLYDTAGYFAVILRYASAADAATSGERVYLDTVVRNSEAAVYGLEPFTRVTCGNVVIVIREDLSDKVSQRLSRTYDCS
jgi:peptidoglycan hydrolase-like protein with peptidoglycan-binding domain